MTDQRAPGPMTAVNITELYARMAKARAEVNTVLEPLPRWIKWIFRQLWPEIFADEYDHDYHGVLQ